MATNLSKNKRELQSLLTNVLGAYYEYTKQNELAFYCPECKHRKRKLMVNMDTGRWHCWVCEVDNNMRGMSLYTLFKRVDAPRDSIDKLNDILGTSNLLLQTQTNDTTVIHRLPREFIPLSLPNKSPHYKHAINYLKRRGVTAGDIVKHNMGYAESGEYKNKIIIPSYNSVGSLNFFVGREFYNQSEFKLHKIPDGWSKDIVGFELFVNWKMPIVLVEGAFDALAIKRNAIPLFGKTISDTLKIRIMEHDVRDIYLALDTDALRATHHIAREFVGHGRNVYVVGVGDKDPSKIGFGGMLERIATAPRQSLVSVIELRLKSMNKKKSFLCT